MATGTPLFLLQPSTKGNLVNRNPGRIWINFKELRARLKFEDVLRHYKVEIRRKGEQHHGSCPLPGHNGSRNAPSFSANLDRGIFQCFGCGAKGNVLEFAALMTGVDPRDGDALRSVAVELQSRFFPEGASSRTKERPVGAPAVPPREVPVVVNAPMDFDLKGLDSGHGYLANRGFATETMQHFGAGFCSRGMLKGRIAIPLHDGEGRLIGFAGRTTDDETITEGNPRYLFPTRRERNGTVYAFDKSLFVYNAFRVKRPCLDLAVVQSFTAVWWLHQHGYSNAVSVMGSECSQEQTEAILGLLKPSGHLWLMTDDSNAGDELARLVIGRFARQRFLRWVRLDEKRQPTDLSVSELKTCFTM